MTISLTDADYVLPTGQVVNQTNGSGVNIQESAGGHSVTIAGDMALTIDSPNPFGGMFPLQYNGLSVNGNGPTTILITPTGVVSAASSAPATEVNGVQLNGGPQVVNQGTIDVSASGLARGLYLGGSLNETVPLANNSGSIHVVSSGSSAVGLDAGVGHEVTNSGHIDVSAANGAVGVAVHLIDLFTNTGVVEVHDLGQGTGSAAVQVDSRGATLIVNSGLLAGDDAIKATPLAPGLSTTQLGGAGPLSVQNTGQMVGALEFAAGEDSLVNSGSIVGAINLGAGNDTYDGRLGTETGLLSAGEGADTLTGGAGFDNFQGNQGNDSLAGGAGDDLVVGGKDDDVQLGGAGDDVVWGNIGNDTLDGGDGADQVRGGQGDDSVSGGAGNDFVSGDRGNDTISGGAGADLFHGSQDAGIDRVLDFHLAEGDRVMLDPGTTYTLSQVGADTVIDMGGGNQMILVGVQLSTLTDGWIFAG